MTTEQITGLIERVVADLEQSNAAIHALIRTDAPFGGVLDASAGNASAIGRLRVLQKSLAGLS